MREHLVCGQFALFTTKFAANLTIINCQSGRAAKGEISSPRPKKDTVYRIFFVYELYFTIS